MGLFSGDFNGEMGERTCGETGAVMLLSLSLLRLGIRGAGARGSGEYTLRSEVSECILRIMCSSSRDSVDVAWGVIGDDMVDVDGMRTGADLGGDWEPPCFPLVFGRMSSP